MKKSDVKKLKRLLKEINQVLEGSSDSGLDDDQGVATGDDHSVDFGKALRAASEKDAYKAVRSDQHVYGNAIRCETDKRGEATPDRRRSVAELVVDAHKGFVPLWAQGVTMKWRFNEPSMGYFRDPEAAKNALKILLGRAIHAWGDAAPVEFKRVEPSEAWDFEVVMMSSNNCNPRGCVLASAFFPDAGQHQLKIYPKMFEQVQSEWVETLVHEIGHVFGLRHFFAKIHESDWPSHIFGTHTPFSIMNYGAKSVLTETDKADLKELYQKVWTGQLPKINGTPIRLFRPYSDSGTPVGT